jgi:hypothetical protein
MEISVGFFILNKVNQVKFQYFSISAIIKTSLTDIQIYRMTVAEYLEKINTRFKTGISREHTYEAIYKRYWKIW